MSFRAVCWLREDLPYRRDAFCDGLRAAGYRVVERLERPDPEDVFVCWNRYDRLNREASRFEACGARAVIVENGYLGKQWLGRNWYSVALSHHAGLGEWPHGGASRWASFGTELGPWRHGGSETLVLGQRGIGEPGIASPPNWAELARGRFGGRTREHPGRSRSGATLSEDLARARCVVTWASAAALVALAHGVPAYYELEGWIGAEAALRASEFGGEPKRDDAARLSMFQRLAWSIWDLEEVRTGAAFSHLLGGAID